MGIWLLAAAVVLVLLAYVAWELRWYLTTLRSSIRRESPQAPDPARRDLAGTATRR